MSRILTLVFAIILSICVSLGIVEIGYRAFLALSHEPPVTSDRPETYFNPAFSPTLQGNVPIEESNNSEMFVLATVGDSFTFAPYMQVDDAFPARLERIFRMSGNPNIQVQNLGVPGFSTSHEAEEVRKAIKGGADFILLQITLNDPQRKSYQPTGLTGINEFGPYAPGETLQKVTRVWKSLGYFLERIHNTQTHSRYVSYYHQLFADEKSWEQFVRSLEKMRRVSNKKQIPLVASVFPLFGLPLNDKYPFHELHQKIMDELDRLKIPAIDLFSSYKDIPLHRLQVIPGVDFHPNEIGHRIAAEAIYAWLRTLDLIPKTFFSAPEFQQRIDIRPSVSHRVVTEAIVTEEQ